MRAARRIAQKRKEKSNKTCEECMAKIAKQLCNGTLQERFITPCWGG